jgi:hypothetical protein
MFHSQQIGIALIQTQIDIMDQIKLGIFDFERQDRERERFAHEWGESVVGAWVYIDLGTRVPNDMQRFTWPTGNQMEITR